MRSFIGLCLHDTTFVPHFWRRPLMSAALPLLCFTLTEQMSDSLAILILTHNEADNLPRCLGSIAGFGEIVVVDSGSDDGTQEIAKEAGARVYQQSFQSFGRQRNWALENCDLKSEWVLFLDADEVATPEFRQAV